MAISRLPLRTRLASPIRPGETFFFPLFPQKLPGRLFPANRNVSNCNVRDALLPSRPMRKRERRWGGAQLPRGKSNQWWRRARETKAARESRQSSAGGAARSFPQTGTVRAGQRLSTPAKERLADESQVKKKEPIVLLKALRRECRTTIRRSGLQTRRLEYRRLPPFYHPSRFPRVLPPLPFSNPGNYWEGGREASGCNLRGKKPLLPPFLLYLFYFSLRKGGKNHSCLCWWHYF